MEKGAKESFIQIPLTNFSRKPYQFPLSLFESRFVSSQKNQIQFRKILQSRGYHVINLISTQRIIFATKQAGSPWIAAVELKQLPQSQKNLYLSLNISLSLHKTIQPYFLMKNWKIQNKIYLHDEKGNGVALVQYHFAESDLRSFIQTQRYNKKKIETDQLHTMFKMLVESTHNAHIENIHLNDIRPETIFFENNKWFVMKGELAEKVGFDYGSLLEKPVGVKPPNKLYCSPLVYQGYKNEHVNHNPFKSDVYALGLVMFELETIGIWSQQMWKEVLENRRGIGQENLALSLDFREKMVIKGKQLFMIPNLLELMLQEKQQQRPYIFEISLLMNYTNLIMNRVLVPHQQFFKFQTIQSTTGKKKIVYPHVSIQYEGNFKQDTREKQGLGIVYYNGIKSFEGMWKNNLPTDKCSVYFSEYWKYEGMMKEGQFHDQGYLFFNGIRINQKKWCYNLSEDRVDISEKPVEFSSGYYFFVKSQQKQDTNSPNKQCKVYFKKFNNTQKVFVLNMYLIDPKQIIFVINKMLTQYTISKVELFEDQNRVLYNCNKHEVIKLYTDDGKVIEIVTGIDHARPLLIKLLESQTLSKVNITLDLSNTSLIDEELRELFDKTARIQSLNIARCKIGDKGLRILSINQGTKYLKTLNLSHLDISDKALSEFTFSKLIQGLQDINISYCKALSSQAITSFLCNQKFRKLRRIQIQATSFTHYGLEHLIKFNNFNKLQYLNIGLCHKINDAYFNSFLKNKISSSITGLSLNSTILTDNILQTMSSDDCKIDQLTSMNLSGSINLSFYGLSKLFISSKIKNLQTINLSGTYIDDQFLILVSKSAHFNCKVKELYMSSCFAITDKGVLKLLKSQYFSMLEILDISKTFISNDLLIGLVELSNRVFKKLVFGKCTKINDNGLEKFIMSDNFRRVEVLNIGYTGVAEGTFTSLSQSRYSSSLKELILEECLKIQEKSIVSYFTSPNFKSIHKINLSKTLITNKVLKSFELNSHNYYKFIQIDITDCKNITNQGLQYICLPNKLISTIKRKQNNNNSIKCLSQSPLLLKMTKLELNTQSETDFPSLFSSQYCMNISNITITDSLLKNCFESMSTSKYLKNIKILSLKSCSVDEAFFKQFLKSENVMHLEELDISWTLLGNATMFAIAESQHLNYLEVLKIIKCININDKGMIKYFNSKVCQSLKVIDLRATLLTNNTLECIAKSSNIKELTHLSIRSCSNMKNLGIESLLNSKNSHSIKYLDLSWNNFNGDIFRYLSNSKLLNELKELEVSGLKGVEAELGNYFNSNNINSLKRLDLSSVGLKEETVKILGNSESLESINELNLSNCNLSKQAIICLLSSKNVEKLQKLNLAFNWNPSEIVKYLIENEKRFQKLETLVLATVKGLNLEQCQKVFKNLTVGAEIK